MKLKIVEMQIERLLRIYSWTLLLLLTIAPQVSIAQTLNFSELPQDLQIVSRNADNIGLVEISGSETAGGFVNIRIDVLQDGVNYTENLIELTYSGGVADFSSTIEIDAGLFDYRFDIYISDGSSETLLRSISGICAGDIFFINGQSNAESKAYSGSANRNTHPFIRSFSPNFTWVQALGDDSSLDSFVGQWPLRLGRQIVERFQIPVGIINGAEGGRPITYFHRNDANPVDPGTNYGRALSRLKNAKVANSIKAVFWYQGEFDKQGSITPENYISLFDQLYQDWKSDFGVYDRIYAFQIRQGCGSQAAGGVQEAQRRMDHIYEDIVLISTTGIDGHDGCHFGYNSGYEIMGDRVSFLLGQDLYDEPKTNFYSPTIQTLFYSNADRSQITFTTQNETDRLVFDSGTETYFSFSDRTVFATGGSASGNSVVLDLNKSAPNNLTLSYDGHTGPGSWITNEKGVGLATFALLPISVDVSNEGSEIPEQESDFMVDLFPVPSSGTIRLNGKIEDQSDIFISVLDINGRIVKNIETYRASDGNIDLTINGSDLSKGPYYLSISTAKRVKYLPFLRN